MRPHPLFPKVVSAMQRIAPLELADRSWDNVGVLVESPALPKFAAATGGRVLLTIDLTPSVVTEAILKEINVIVAYHPFIFSGLKAITLRDPKQAALMQLVQSGISVYCPHSALDACTNGLNDWLCDMVTSSADNAHVTVPITPDKLNPAVGIGRFRTFGTRVTLEEAIAGVKRATGIPNLRLALPDDKRKMSLSEITLGSVAVCAGSGSTVFRGLKRDQQADLILSGEMGHHDVLGFIQKGAVVILCEHTNSERGYLKAQLQGTLAKELNNKDVEIVVSELDEDPLKMV